MTDDEEAAATLGRVLAGFLDAAHEVVPDRLSVLVEDAARELGATVSRMWLADHQYRTLLHLSSGDAEDPIPIDGSAAGRCFITSEILSRAHEDGGGHHLWLPLLDGVDRIGVLEVEIGELTDAATVAYRQLASVATAELVTRGQYTDRFTVTRRVRPMTLAAELQWQTLPPASFRATDVTVSGMLEPAYEVGGDCFDYAHRDDHLAVAVLDAVGHDLTSSLVSTLAVTTYRNCRRTGYDLRDTAAAVDASVKAQLGRGAFATAVLADLDTATGTFRWLNAGHPPPLLIRNGKVVRELVCRPRAPLGLGHLQPDHVAEIAEDQLEPGDALLLYTDGIVEARRPGGQDFGLERLEQFLEHAFAAGLPPAETVRRLSNAVLDHHGGQLRDDATTLLVVWRPET